MAASAIAALLLGSGLASAAATSAPLTSQAGQTVAIPSWDLTSSSDASKDLGSLSKPGGVDTSSWFHTSSSRCTIMGCLIDGGYYNTSYLWFSENLNTVNWGQFTVPWLYRNEFALSPASGKHFVLQTNGITSKADLFFNGKQIANSTFQSGAYGGHNYDITSLVAAENALVVQVYPTDYNYDFAVGFVDWNPYSPDNGTGVWREITIKETGPVSMGPLSVLVDINTPVEHSPAEVTVRTLAQNLQNSTVTVAGAAIITDNNGHKQQTIKQTVTLGPYQTKLVEFKQTLSRPNIWWPKQWGGQPLYTANVTLSVGSAVSDAAGTSFGIRKVTRILNQWNDTQFSVNGYPFQVVGGGYGADMFLRWDSDRFTKIVQYMLDMSQNTIRLEGKMEQPELYDIADRLGLMVMPGWECCDKWEAWSYNDELSVSPVPVWDANDYATANASIIHEAAMIQTHPSLLAFLVGSDYWPNDEATTIYLDGLNNAGWQNPIVASAAERGYPEQLGISGMQMNGPYDWIPPNYWYDVEPYDVNLGTAYGFNSELGAGVGTPELGSLKQFLSQSDMDDLWQNPNKNLFHMSSNVSSFYNREIYNQGLWNRYGAPTSLDDYLVKAQMMDYEATRAQYEAFSAFWNAKRPATGLIYWMLNNAWPSLHWNQFDWYLHPAGSYFGTKVGSRVEHIAYNYLNRTLWAINHSLSQKGPRDISVDLIDLSGKSLFTQKLHANTVPNTGFQVGDISSEITKLESVALLRLVLANHGKVLSRNVYWVTNSVDELDFNNATWYNTPVTSFVDYTPLNKLETATVSVKVSSNIPKPEIPGGQSRTLVLQNKSSVPAVFIRLTLVDKDGNDVNPVIWSDNYVALWPKESLTIEVSGWDSTGVAVQVSGKNIQATTIAL